MILIKEDTKGLKWYSSNCSFNSKILVGKIIQQLLVSINKTIYPFNMLIEATSGLSEYLTLGKIEYLLLHK